MYELVCVFERIVYCVFVGVCPLNVCVCLRVCFCESLGMCVSVYECRLSLSELV